MSAQTLKHIWWLIEINAAIWFVYLGYLAKSNTPTNEMVFPLVGLFVAAVLHFVAYYKAYKPYIKNSNVSSE